MLKFPKIFLIATFLNGHPALSEDKPSTFTINLFGSMTIYAPPPWVKSGNPLEQIETYRDQGRFDNGIDYFMLEYVPKGDTFEEWSELYAVFAQIPVSGAVEDHRDQQLRIYQDACSSVNWQASNTTPEGVTLFLIYCPSYQDQAKIGEVAVFKMMRMGDLLVKNYYHKRVPAFDMEAIGENPPISKDELYVAISAVGALQLVTGKD